MSDFAPAVVGVSAQLPAATVQTQSSVPSLTAWPTTERSGVSPVIAVAELPDVTVTVAGCATATVLIVAEIVLEPVVSELNVAVNTPLVFVVPVVGVRAFPVPPVAARVTFAPPIGLSWASRAVTVRVDEPVAAVIDVGAAATVDCDAETASAVTVTVAGCVTSMVPFTVAVTVLFPAAVELSVPVIWPLALVVPTG